MAYAHTAFIQPDTGHPAYLDLLDALAIHLSANLRQTSHDLQTVAVKPGALEDLP